MKFAVTVNDSPKHIVHASSIESAVKATLASLRESDEHPGATEPVTIRIVPIAPKAKAEKTVERGHVAEGVVG